MFSSSSLKIVLGIGLIFATGVIAGYIVARRWDHKAVVLPVTEAGTTASKQIRQMGHYTYINPLLECDVADGTIDSRKENFHSELEAAVARIKREQNLSEVAVYFRDLNNGPTFGVDEEGEFFPASLLKVPVLIAYYHLAEQDQSVLATKIVFEKPIDFGITPTIIPRENLVVGETYTVEELLRRMIVYSDNQALALLSARLPIATLQDLFAIIGVGGDVIVNSEAKLTVREYAGFFRILFNSSYLSRESSEKALALLSSTDYNDALPAGVPGSITVAHKFGEAGTGEIERQLHDCGIIYFPDHPYLACIMTRGRQTENLKAAIIATSKFIYTKIDEQY